MIVLVFGGRDYMNRRHVFLTLDRVHAVVGIERVVEGGAIGADRQGRLWAQSRGVKVATYRAAWTKHFKAAGIIRNAEMMVTEDPDLGVGFPGGAGTADMARRLRRAGVPVIEARS